MAATNIKLIKVILLLVVFAIGSIMLRLWFQQADGVPSGDQIWSIKQIINVHAKSSGALVKISHPDKTQQVSIYEQKYLHPGMRLRISKTGKQNKEIVFAASGEGLYTLEMIYTVHLSHVKKRFSVLKPSPDLKRSQWLLSSADVPADSARVALLLDSIKNNTTESDALMESIFNYVAESIRIVPEGSDNGGEVVERQNGSVLGVNRALLALLRAAHFPARLVTGLDLSRDEVKQPVYWVEVYQDNQWLPMDVVGIHFKELPVSFIPVKKGGYSLINTENSEVKNIGWQFTQLPAHKGVLASADNPSIKDVLDLTRLDPNVRIVLSILLLLPLGALLTEILRQFGGVRTYGTFTPTLLALAAVFVDWVSAASTFALVTLLGVAGRALLDDMGLSRVARLSIVFTMVAFIMALVVSLLIYYQPSMDAAVVLLPIVILTTVVDRVYSVMDESGLRVALMRLGWTVVAAIVSVFVLIQDELGAWIVKYPEIHAMTTAAIILLGRYKGPQLLDLAWLRWLKEPVDKKTKSAKVKADDKASM